MSSTDSPAPPPGPRTSASSGDSATLSGNDSNKSGNAAKARKPAKAKKPRKRFSILRFSLLLILFLAAFGGAMGYWGIREFSKDLPDRWSALTDYRPPKSTRVYSQEGELIGEFYLEKRVVVPYEKMPKHLPLAFVAAEDNRFFDHHGVDPLGIMRAAIANARAGRVVQGGSTITQQVAKLMLVGNEKKLIRKIREALLASKIESKLTKEQILGIYLNHVYLGHGAYGVQAAAEIYFGKDVDNLSIAEAAMIAGLPKAPTEDSPFTAFPRAKDRQRYVLGQMAENGFITKAEEEAARKEPIAIISRDAPLNHVAAPYFVEFVRKYVKQKYGGNELYNQGLRIHTSLSMRQQRAAETAVRRGLEDLDRRLGFRGPLGHVEPEKLLADGPVPYVGPREDWHAAAGAVLVEKPYVSVITSMGRVLVPGKKSPQKGILVAIGGETYPLVDEDVARIEHWSQKKGNHVAVGDQIPVKVVNVEVKRGSGKRATVETSRMAVLAQRPDVEAALVAVDPATGYLTAMVGGYDYDLSQFNRAVQARRQAGSSIKPYIYAAAVEKGYTELTSVVDGPIAIHTAAGLWTPHNYRNEFLGPVTLRTALAKSLNTVSVRLVESVGVDNTIEMFRRFGITSPVPRHISIALGVPELSPMEAAYAQATFPAGGAEVKPLFITRIYDADGNVVEEHVPPRPSERKQRIPADTAYIMVDLMKNVVQNGTGRHAQALGRPAAGKTGTSNDFKDAWFVGYTADLLAVVWVGRDDFHPIGYDTTGGQTALPLWLDFMQHGYPDVPIRDFTPPPNVLFVRATSDKGAPARPGQPGSVLIPFKRGTLPRDFEYGARNASFADGSF